MLSLTESPGFARSWKSTQSLQQFQAGDFVSQVPGSSQDKGQVSYSSHWALHPPPPTGGANQGVFVTFERGGKGEGADRYDVSPVVIHDVLNGAKDKIMNKYNPAPKHSYSTWK